MATMTGAHAAAVPPTKTRPGEHPYVSSCRVQTLARSKFLLAAAMCESISPGITVPARQVYDLGTGAGVLCDFSRSADREKGASSGKPPSISDRSVCDLRRRLTGSV